MYKITEKYTVGEGRDGRSAQWEKSDSEMRMGECGSKCFIHSGEFLFLCFFFFRLVGWGKKTQRQKKGPFHASPSKQAVCTQQTAHGSEDTLPLIQTVFHYSDELVALASTVVYGGKFEVLIAFGNSGVFSGIYNTFACLGFFAFPTLVKFLHFMHCLFYNLPGLIKTYRCFKFLNSTQCSA